MKIVVRIFSLILLVAAVAAVFLYDGDTPKSDDTPPPVRPIKTMVVGPAKTLMPLHFPGVVDASTGVLIRQSTIQCYADTNVYADASMVPATYRLVSNNYVSIRVANGQASPATVTFYYQRGSTPTPNIGVSVPVYYLDSTNLIIARESRTLYQSGAVAADTSLIPAGYTLTGSSVVYVTLSGSTASPNPILFRLNRSQTATPVPAVVIPVYYVNNATGRTFASQNVTIYGSTTVYPQSNMVPSGYTLIDSIDDAAGVLVRSADMKEMAFPAGLRAIARAGAGVNNIPLDRCAEEGIVVFNTPGANANSVKELVICGMLLASRDIAGGISWVRENADDADIAKTTEKAKKAFAGHELMGKTLGVVGLGAIGVLVANAAVSLGMKVYGFDPYLSVNSAWNLSPMVIHAEKIEEIFAVSDFITIHVPATASTKGMISADAIAQMKNGAVLLNFARDTLVDEKALASALESGVIKRYVSDFPTPASAHMKNAIVIPHLGASTEEAEDNCAVMAVRQLQDYLDNGNIHNSVNYPEINLGVCETEARVGILHRNIPNMLSQITNFFGNQGLNIENLANKSRGDYAYTLLDLSHPMPHDTVERLKEIDGVIRVRRIVENK